MRKSKFNETQIVEILKDAEGGIPVADLLRKHGVSKATFFKWRSKYGGATVADVKRLRELDCGPPPGSRCGRARQGPLPQTRVLGGELLPLAEQVRRHERLGREALEGARARKRTVKEAAGGLVGGKTRSPAKPSAENG